MGNIQNTPTLIRPYKMSIKMGEVLNPHINMRGHFDMVEQYREHPNHNSTMHNFIAILQVRSLFTLLRFEHQQVKPWHSASTT